MLLHPSVAFLPCAPSAGPSGLPRRLRWEVRSSMQTRRRKQIGLIEASAEIMLWLLGFQPLQRASKQPEVSPFPPRINRELGSLASRNCARGPVASHSPEPGVLSSRNHPAPGAARGGGAAEPVSLCLLAAAGVPPLPRCRGRAQLSSPQPSAGGSSWQAAAHQLGHRRRVCEGGGKQDGAGTGQDPCSPSLQTCPWKTHLETPARQTRTGMKGGQGAPPSRPQARRWASCEPGRASQREDQTGDAAARPPARPAGAGFQGPVSACPPERPMAMVTGTLQQLLETTVRHTGDNGRTGCVSHSRGRDHVAGGRAEVPAGPEWGGCPSGLASEKGHRPLQGLSGLPPADSAVLLVS
uniref:Uncharacterized protein n=1 Tax=Pipistrellus kuhlii TaxID=59472 RepID=A0A7J7TNK7_PIPKU|nr:hypothetical protein mPipKuh1_009328 [Pipistrellus kuhlii]